MKKKILILGMLVLILSILLLSGCKVDNNTNINVGIPPIDSSTGETDHTHVFDQNIATEAYLKTAATCTAKAVYYKSCACGEKGKETFTAGELLAHTYNQENISIDYRKSAATCTSKAVYYKSCTCGSYGEDTFEFGVVLPHNYDQEVAAEAHLKTAANCTEKAVYYKSCVCGANGLATFEHGEFVHIYNQENPIDTFLKNSPTCISQAEYYKSCSCGLHGTETFFFGTPLSHNYDQEIKADKYIKTPGTLTEKTVYYKSCSCGEAGTDTFEGEVIDNAEFYSGFTFADYETGCMITDYTGTRTVFAIPETSLDEKIVLRIDSEAFKDCTAITKILIPASITSIAEDAFEGCTGLVDIVVASGNTAYKVENHRLVEIATGKVIVILGISSGGVLGGIGGQPGSDLID